VRWNKTRKVDFGDLGKIMDVWDIVAGEDTTPLSDSIGPDEELFTGSDLKCVAHEVLRERETE